jgi:hypothetical protein
VLNDAIRAGDLLLLLNRYYQVWKTLDTNLVAFHLFATEANELIRCGRPFEKLHVRADLSRHKSGKEGVRPGQPS